MNVKDFIKQNITLLDGGMGTLLQEKGLLPGEHPERWNITHPDIIIGIHKAYFDSGSNIVCTNTFGANLIKFSHEELEGIISAAFLNAKKARDESNGSQEKFIALDLGPTGKLLKPYGDLDFEEAVSVFSETVRLGVKYGAELIFIETMNDSYETKAALLAAKENSDLPVFVSNAYDESGKLMTGATPEAMAVMLEGMGADAIGANCSLGPMQLEGVIKRLLKVCSVPVILKPNAGLPKVNNSKTVFDVSPDEFSKVCKRLALEGVRIIGGCCGTTPEYINALKNALVSVQPCMIEEKNITCVSSYTHCVKFGDLPILIGERINPTGKKRFKQALIENDIDYILKEGINQEENGADILDVNVGLPDIDEKEMLTKAVCELQAITSLPLQIDTSDASAMESALRRYNGKALINSVNGKEESMNAVFPLMKKYGGVLIALTLDENGIPETAEGRVKIAEKIIKRAEDYGIKKKDIIFDTLAMAISADSKAASVTLKALDIIRHKLGCHTSLGVSNISFGLPSRDMINSAFFTAALERGLSAAIMNPYSNDMKKSYYSYLALHGLDENFRKYIEFSESCVPPAETYVKEIPKAKVKEYSSALQGAVIKGLKEDAASLCAMLLTTTPPLEIVQNEIIPALDIVGKGFEEKTVYLPQLLMSAEASKAAFEKIKENMADSGGKAKKKCTFVIATVKGDIHDIGKNIVKLLLENYGFDVIDLGKDVPPEKITKEVVRLHAPLAGLSALMTTTVSAMEDTIKLLRKNAPWCRIVVGGAVLNEEYAKSIGADKYARDAMETVRYAEEILKENT